MSKVNQKCIKSKIVYNQFYIKQQKIPISCLFTLSRVANSKKLLNSPRDMLKDCIVNAAEGKMKVIGGIIDQCTSSLNSSRQMYH